MPRTHLRKIAPKSARILACSIVACSALAASAADQTWNTGGPSDLWNTTDTNWDAGAAWIDGNVALFTGTGEPITVSTVTANGLNFSGTGYTLSGSTITLAGPATIITGNDATISSAIAGTVGLTKEGVGKLTLSGAKSYSGNTVINDGILRLQTSGFSGATTISGTGTLELAINNAVLGATGTTVTIGAGFTGLIDAVESVNMAAHSGLGANLGDLNVAATRTVAINGVVGGSNTPFQFDVLTGSGTIANGAVASNAPSTLRFGANNGSGTFGGNITSSSATNGRIVLVKNGTGTQTFTGNISNGNGGLTINAGTVDFNGGSQTLTAIAGAGALIKSGTGTLIVAGNSTMTGTTTVTGGILQVQTGGNWSAATILDGGTLAYNGLAPAGSYKVIGGAVTANSASFITVQSATSGATNSNQIFLDGGLKGSAPVTITSSTNGAGVVLRTSNSNFSGTLTVNGNASTVYGTGSGLAIGAVSTPNLANADIIVNGTMELGRGGSAGMGWASGSVSGTTFQMDALGGTGVVVSNMDTGTNTRTLSLGNNNGGDLFSGIIANGANNTLSLIKNGSGTQTLAGDSTYTGSTTVTGGALLVSGSLSGTLVNILGGTFGGTGSVTTSDKAFTLASGAKLDPGTNGLDGFSIITGSANFDLSAGVGGANTGALLYNLGSVASSDKITLTLGTGVFDTGGALDFADFAFTTSAGFGVGTYTLFATNKDASGVLAGSGLTGTVGGFDATLSTAGNDVILTVVPEPNVAVTLLGGIGVLLGLRRRRSVRY